MTNKQSCMNLKIGKTKIENSTCGKLVGVKVDHRLKFNEQLDGIIKKAICKVIPLSRIFPFGDLTERHF